MYYGIMLTTTPKLIIDHVGTGELTVNLKRELVVHIGRFTFVDECTEPDSFVRPSYGSGPCALPIQTVNALVRRCTSPELAPVGAVIDWRRRAQVRPPIIQLVAIGMINENITRYRFPAHSLINESMKHQNFAFNPRANTTMVRAVVRPRVSSEVRILLRDHDRVTACGSKYRTTIRQSGISYGPTTNVRVIATCSTAITSLTALIFISYELLTALLACVYCLHVSIILERM
jgi:hypothetical protein